MGHAKVKDEQFRVIEDVVRGRDTFLRCRSGYETTIAVTYLVVTLTFSTVNVCTVHSIPLHARIGFGYVMFTVALVFVLLLDIAIQNCALDSNVSFVLTLCAVLTVGIGSGMQQSTAAYRSLSLR
eukprot:Em0020g190a